MQFYSALKKAVRPHNGAIIFLAILCGIIYGAIIFLAILCGIIAVPSLIAGEDMLIVGIVALVGVILCIIGCSVRKKNSKRCFDALEKDGAIDIAYADLTNPAAFKSKKGSSLVLGDRYVFDTKAGMIYKYNEILVMYKQINRQGVIPVSQMLIAKLANGKTVNLAVDSVNKKADERFEAITQRIRYYNPSVLVGFTGANMKEYKRLRKEIKEKGLEAVVPSVTPVVFVAPDAAAEAPTAPVDAAPAAPAEEVPAAPAE